MDSREGYALEKQYLRKSNDLAAKRKSRFAISNLYYHGAHAAVARSMAGGEYKEPPAPGLGHVRRRNAN
jgi:hypothetical protein